MFYRPIDARLTLRLPTVYDAAEAYAIIDAERDRLGRFLPWVETIQSIEDEREALRRLAPLDPDKQVNCFLTLDRRIIGAVSVVTIDRPAQWAEIGFWIESEQEGKGYVTAAVRELERLCFLDLNLGRVQITADASNSRSRAVAERLGYTYEGALRRHMVSGRHLAHRAIYALLKPEWQARERS